MNTLTDTQVAMLQDALDYIVAHPEEWDQSVWVSFIWKDGMGHEEVESAAPVSLLPACGTAACLAGRVALQALDTDDGFEMTRFTFDPCDGSPEVEYISMDNVVYRGHTMVLSDAVALRIAGTLMYPRGSGGNFEEGRFPFDVETAATLHSLFDPGNRLSQLFYYAQRLTGGRIRVPEGIESND